LLIFQKRKNYWDIRQERDLMKDWTSFIIGSLNTKICSSGNDSEHELVRITRMKMFDYQ
jgi:hypothetical protein